MANGGLLKTFSSPCLLIGTLPALRAGQQDGFAQVSRKSPEVGNPL
jgi:hypothetical protein